MNRRLAMAVVGAAVISAGVMAAQQPQPAAGAAQPLRVFIRAGEKTHGAGGNGLHDYPAFLGSWHTVLKDRGAAVDGALHFPTADELARTDVLINFKGDGGTCSQQERALLEAYLKRGGGLVTMHDGMCSDDAKWFATIAGGAKQHGERNSSSGLIKVSFVDKAHEITKGLPDFELDDEAFFLLTKDPSMHVLATAPIPSSNEVVPQIWTAEKALAGGKPYRSFVYMLGHRYENWANPNVQTMMLRAIAWAGRRPADLLTHAPAPPERGTGGGGRGGRTGGQGQAPGARGGN
jgi:type 1 glutamine amidotransferase